jgi:sphingolipid 8-(E)-desaturase
MEEQKSSFDDRQSPPVASEGSSSASSTQCSPLFEPAESILKYRNKAIPTSSSASSISSISLDQGGLEEEHPKMSFLDHKTQEELDLDVARYPPTDPITQDEIVQKYRKLKERIEAEGLYQCRYTAYLAEICRYSLLFGTFIYFLRKGWYAMAGFFCGAFWHQLVFSAHDAGHNGITHRFHVDSVIGIIIADFLGGLSIGWWKRNHNTHHLVTNSPEHDPDIEHMPFFAISHRFLNSLYSTYYGRVMDYDAFAKTFIRYQNYLYYPVMLFGRFNLYRLSWEYLLGGQAPRKGPAWWHRWLEMVGQVFFWTWYGYFVTYKSIPTAWGRFVFVMVSHMITMPLHVQITLSHFAMSTSDLGVEESFPQKMLRTTMDVDCPQWLDFVHGGLQFQAIHHLYPRIPRHNLRRTQKLVQEFCDDVKIPYALFGFVDGNKQVIGRLGEVARQAAILAECQRTIAAEGHFTAH